jgi:hypothetical protein
LANWLSFIEQAYHTYQRIARMIPPQIDIGGEVDFCVWNAQKSSSK